MYGSTYMKNINFISRSMPNPENLHTAFEFDTLKDF